MSTDDSHLVWGISLVIYGIFVRSPEKQQLHSLDSSLTGGKVERGVAQTVLC